MNKTLPWPEIRGHKFDTLQKFLHICVSIVGVDLFNVTSLNVIFTRVSGHKSPDSPRTGSLYSYEELILQKGLDESCN